MESKFKLGDTVRVVTGDYNFNDGHIGIVLEIDSNGYSKPLVALEHVSGWETQDNKTTAYYICEEDVELVNKTQEKEQVNHPSHYQNDKFEVIEIIEAYKLGFNLGNCIKYVLRAGKKDSSKTIQDLDKAVWYLNRHINNLKGESK